LPSRPLQLEARASKVAPMSLTASDGTGLKLVSLTARGVVEEPLAFTELRMVFENPTDRTIEGRFEINMPPDAAISRFAMKIAGAWMEGEVVERHAAQVAFEDALHRKQDPALLENKAGNAFSARVFPIQPRERKELILSYSQELSHSAEPYRLMLRGLPELDELDASVVLRETTPTPGGITTSLATTTAQTRTIELKKQHWAPDQDLEISSSRGRQAIGLRHENLALARVAASGDMPPAPIGGLTVLFDTSASRALDFDRQIADLSGLITSLRDQTGEDFALRVLCFDQSTEEVYAGPASGLNTTHLQRISARRALGASDLRRALAVAGTGTVHPRLLVLSDGVGTAGRHELADLEGAARILAAAGVARIDAIVDGGIQDATGLEALTTAEIAHKGVVADGRLTPPALAHKLASQTLADMKVSVPGAKWVWPETVEGAQPGDEVLVYADLPADVAMRVVLTGESTISTEVETTPAERPLLERAWVGASIERLTAERSRVADKDYPPTIGKPPPVTPAQQARNDLQAQIVALSTKFRVLSDFTALLVLETEWDYRRFNIDRNALTDIMVAGPTGVALQNRVSPAPLPSTSPAPPARLADSQHVPQMARNFDPEMAARQAGILGTMQQTSGNFLASPYGGAFAVGNDDADVWGGLTGTEVGEAYGVGGLGLVGTGRGGGGTGEGTIGLGNTGLIGRGGGGGTGSGYGRGAGAGFGGRGTSIPTVRQAKAEVQGALDKDIIRRIVRAHINEIRYCYNQTLARDPSEKGRVAIQFTIGATGKVPSAVVQESSMRSAQIGNCMAQAVRRWTFPRPADGNSVIVTYPFVFESDYRGPPLPPPPPPTPEELARQEAARAAEAVRQAERERQFAEERARYEAEEKVREAEREAEHLENVRTQGSPYQGKLFDVMKLLQAGDHKAGLALALQWHEQSPGDVLALLALGEALEAAGDRETAARAYGSIIDLFPSRADLRRYVGGRLERLGPVGLELAIDTYAQAVEQRPDHPASHRLYAFALAQAGRHAEAFAAILAGNQRTYPGGRFLGVDRILKEDAALLVSAWLAAEPLRDREIRAEAAKIGVIPDRQPSLRFVLTWETDANDVDFHVIDRTKEHASYSHKRLASGGELFADVTTGYGPECFAIPGEATAFPYQFQAHYYARGPMGYGMGKLQIVQHDGKGGLRFDNRPFIIMKDHADVELGTLTGPLPRAN
jgi:TonB family protein